jgi:hypothetical protein
MGTTTHTPIEVNLDQPSVEERRALIERVAASEHFRRSARLRDFLLYVGRQSLKEGCPEINEQEVGAHVFGRSATYDRSQDNIVRVNATELRKRIDAYFETEGADESLVLEIPRGGYKPVFHRRGRPSVTPVVEPHGSLATVASPPEAVAPAAKAAASHTRANLLWATACLVLAATVAFLFLQNRTLRTPQGRLDGKPALASFWGGFLSDHRQTDIVLSDDSLSVIQDVTHRPVTLHDYLDHSYMRDIQASDLSADRKADLTQIFGHNLVTFGAIRAAEQIQSVLPASSTNLTLSRFYLADSIKQDNVILVGGMKANPWVDLLDAKMNFSLQYDGEHALGFIANRNPRTGEQTQYSSTKDPTGFVGYSALAYLPNPGGTGNAIILAGTDSDATAAAAEFLTSEGDMENLRNALHAKTLPYFEVLLKTSRISGTSFNSEMLAYRAYPASQ